jgi:hypothetical protein
MGSSLENRRTHEADGEVLEHDLQLSGERRPFVFGFWHDEPSKVRSTRREQTGLSVPPRLKWVAHGTRVVGQEVQFSCAQQRSCKDVTGGTLVQSNGAADDIEKSVEYRPVRQLTCQSLIEVASLGPVEIFNRYCWLFQQYPAWNPTQVLFVGPVMVLMAATVSSGMG